MSPNRAHLEQAKYLPVVRTVMTQAGLNMAEDRWDIRTSGSAHIVINMGNQLSIRVAKTPEVGASVARRTEILRILPTMPFEIPRPITRTITRNGYTAVGVTWVKGEPRKPGPVNPKQVVSLLKAIHAVDPEPLLPYLDHPHQHWGGTNWAHTLREKVKPLLLRSNRKVADAIVDAVLELEPQPTTFIHNDLAGHNILWNGERLTGVIDWDHATVSDPAFDYAALGNWYGWDSLKKALSAEQIHRAQIFSNLLALQAVAYGIKNGKGGAIVRLAVERADNWLMDHRSDFFSI